MGDVQYDRIDNECMVFGAALRALHRNDPNGSASRELQEVLLRAAALQGMERAEMNELLRHGGRLTELLAEK